MEDIELEVESLLALENPKEFKKFLYSLHQEVDITEVDALKELYSNHRMWNHVEIIQEFESIFL